MSTVEEQVVDAPKTEEQTPPSDDTAQAAPQLTEEEVDSVFRSGDAEKIETLRKQLFEPVEGERVVPAVPVIPDPAAEQPAQPATTDSKKFKVNFHGTDIEVDDSNNLIGYQSVDQLKKAKIHSDLFIESLKKKEAESRRETEQYVRELSEMRKKMAELEKGREPGAVAPPQAQTPTPQKSAEQNPPKPRADEIPEYPDIPDDPTDWTAEDAAKHKQYLKEHSRYLKSLAENISVSREEIERIAEEKANQRTAHLQEELERHRSIINDVEKTRQQLDAEKKENQHWERFSQFQALHKNEFGTSTPLRTLHEKVLGWMDDLAFANGWKKPFDVNSPDYQKYENAKLTIASMYMNNDPEVRKKSEGIEPPKETDVYFKISDVYNKLSGKYQKHLDNGMSLHHAYLMELDETGQLDQDVNTLRAEERKRATEDYSKALTDTSNYAATVPNSLAQQGMQQSDVTKEDYGWFEEVTNDPRGYQKLSVDDRKKYDFVAKKLGFM